MQQPTDSGDRALRMMQLLAPIDTGDVVREGPDRGIVERADALKALALIFAVVDRALQEGRIDLDEAKHAMRMLVVARECICPIPDPPGEGAALFRADLQEAVNILRASSA